jgi:hypothetical protein
LERAAGDCSASGRRDFLRLEANIALYELEWREKPFRTRKCSIKRLEAMWRAVSSECRSEFDIDVTSKIEALTPASRFVVYELLLSIVENAPRDAPVLATRTPSIRGKYMQEWSARLYQAGDAEKRFGRLDVMKNAGEQKPLTAACTLSRTPSAQSDANGSASSSSCNPVCQDATFASAG